MFNMIVFLAEGQTDGSNSGQFISLIIMLALMFGIFYFLILRPQNKKEKQRLQMLNSLKKNDTVLTTGGIYGLVTNLKDNEVTLKIDDDANVKVRVARNAIVGIINKSDAKIE